MFSKELRNWIASYVSGDYTGNLDGAIDAFERVLDLPAPSPALAGIHDLLPTYLEDIAVASTLPAAIKQFEHISKTEPFLKHLFFYVHPDRASAEPRLSDSPEWTMAPLLKEGLAVVPSAVNLKTGNPQSVSFPYREQYLNAYNIRNLKSHDFEIMRQPQFFACVTAVLIVYLDVSYRNRAIVSQLVESRNIHEAFNAQKYCQEIIRKYKKKERDGFVYVETRWESDLSDGVQTCRVEEILDNDAYDQVRLLGEAGCGKTTALLRLQYLAACRYVNRQSDKIPVLIPLIDFEKSESAVPALIPTLQRHLGVDEDICLSMLRKNEIVLYLDGYNEILDNKKKKQFAWSMETFQQDYPDIRIYLTDRAITKSYIPIMESAENFHLYPLSPEMKKAIIEGNCKDEAAKQILLQVFENRPEYFDNFSTPLRIMCLILVTTRKKALSEDPVGDYMEYLFERERVEKKDENTAYLSRIAQALALMDEHEIPTLRAERCIGRLEFLLNYKLPDSRVCLKLLIEMGILVCENEQISFAQDEYQSYFWVSALTDGLDEILQTEE